MGIVNKGACSMSVRIEDVVDKLVKAIQHIVFADMLLGTPFRHARNKGEVLISRLKTMGVVFSDPRVGDARKVRTIYSTIRWMIETHDGDQQ